MRERLELLVMAELFTFVRHTITQMLMSLGLNEQDWSGWYRLFSQERFHYDAASSTSSGSRRRKTRTQNPPQQVGAGE